MSHRIATTARAAAGRASSARLASAAIGRRAAPTAVSASQGDGSPSASSQLRRGCSSEISRPTLISPRWPSRLARSSAYAAPSSRRSLLTSCAPTRGISSTPHLRDDAAEPKPAEEAAKEETPAAPTADDDDPCPPWQNPLHHNNPDYTGKVLAEDFAPGEEMPSVPLPPFETEGEEGKVLAPPHIHELADEIVKLNMLEVKELVDRIGDHFGFDDEDGYVDEDGGGGGGGEEEAAAVEEKTAFELKLMGYDAKGKIKVIKEVRGMAGLGLKEAKELVEGAPTVIKKDVKKEEAEELKAKLEAVGAQVEIV